MEFFGKHRLVPHSQVGAKGVQSVEVDVIRATNTILLMYSVEPADSLLLPAFERERRDNLWHGTCFELFVKPESRGFVGVERIFLRGLADGPAGLPAGRRAQDRRFPD